MKKTTVMRLLDLLTVALLVSPWPYGKKIASVTVCVMLVIGAAGCLVMSRDLAKKIQAKKQISAITWLINGLYTFSLIYADMTLLAIAYVALVLVVNLRVSQFAKTSSEGR